MSQPNHPETTGAGAKTVVTRGGGLPLYRAAAVYTGLGLLAGLFYREFTKSQGFTGESTLSVLHTHLIALGTLVMLVLLALERAYRLSTDGRFRTAQWIYHAGMAITVTAMTVKGVLQVQGGGSNPALAGIAGLGHVLLTVAFVLIFVVLGPKVAAGDRGEL